MARHDRSELLSQEVGEIISARPHWIVRRGTGIVFVVVLGLSALAGVVRYPDVIAGAVRITAVHAPKLATTRADGHLERLLVTDGQRVVLGQHLAVVQNTARYGEVVALQSWIADVTVAGGDELARISRWPLPMLAALGEVQPAYQELQNVLRESLQIRGGGYYERRKAALLRDLEHLAALRLSIERQQQLQREDYQLQQIELRAQEALGRSDLVAPLELNQNRSRSIGKKQTLEQGAAQLIANDMTRDGTRKELLDLEKQTTDQRQRLHSALLTLKARLAEWERQYVVVAPETGALVFTSFLQQHQRLTAGQQLFYVRPAGTAVYGEMVASQHGIGKIRPGQRALVRVASAPSTEFGYLVGVVGSVSELPVRGDSFLVRVELPSGLRTNQRHVLPFRDGLVARGEIITDDRRLIERLTGQLSGLVAR